jgi:hypothetical protein
VYPNGSGLLGFLETSAHIPNDKALARIKKANTVQDLIVELEPIAPTEDDKRHLGSLLTHFSHRAHADLIYLQQNS